MSVEDSDELDRRIQEMIDRKVKALALTTKFDLGSMSADDKLMAIKEIIGDNDDLRLQVVTSLMDSPEYSAPPPKSFIRKTLGTLWSFLPKALDTLATGSFTGSQAQPSIEWPNHSMNGSISHEDLQLQLALALSRVDDQVKPGGAKRPNLGSNSNLADFLTGGAIRQRMKESIGDQLRQPFSPESVAEIEQILDVFEVVNNCNTNQPKAIPQLQTIGDYNRISTLALKTCAVFGEVDFIKEVVAHFRPLIARFQDICDQGSIQPFNEKQHTVDQTVKFPKAFLEHFERVLVRGDGNCIWHSVSIALFGDYSASEALRLLTAATLIDYEREFRGRFDEQEMKFGYRPDVTYDQLLATSIQMSTWGDEYQLVALSMAIRRPIYSYGSFGQFGDIGLPPGAAASPYDVAKIVYDRLDSIGHYRHVGFEVDDIDTIEPICIYYDGQTHYCAVLPRDVGKKVKPWKPRTMLLEYLIPKSSEEPIDAVQASKSKKEALAKRIEACRKANPQWLEAQKASESPKQPKVTIPKATPSAKPRQQLNLNLKQSPRKVPEVIRHEAESSSRKSSRASQTSAHSFQMVEEGMEIDSDFDKINNSNEDLSPENYNKYLHAQNDSNVQKYQEETVKMAAGFDIEEQEMNNLKQWLYEDQLAREMEPNTRIIPVQREGGTYAEKVKSNDLKSTKKATKSEEFILKEAIEMSLKDNDKKAKSSDFKLPSTASNFEVKGTKSTFQCCFQCTELIPYDSVVVLECLHKFCTTCFLNYLEEEVAKTDVGFSYLCPLSGCREKISDLLISNFLPSTPAVEPGNLTDVNVDTDRNEAEKLAENFKANMNETTCPQCGVRCQQEVETCMGSCNICDYLFCIHCRKDYHGNNSTVTCNLSETDLKEMIQLHQRQEADIARYKAEKEAALQGPIKKPNYEAFGYMPEPLYSVGNIQLVCSTCRQGLEKFCENKERDVFFKENFSYFRCRCQPWRILNKDIERWIEQARKSGHKFERIPLNRYRYLFR